MMQWMDEQMLESIGRVCTIDHMSLDALFEFKVQIY